MQLELSSLGQLGFKVWLKPDSLKARVSLLIHMGTWVRARGASLTGE